MPNTLQLITLQCPSCGGRTSFPPGSDRLTCQYCGNEHALALPTAPSGPAFMPRPLLGKPNEVSLGRDGESLVIRVRWRTWKVLPIAFFCLFWDGFLCFWYSMAFRGGAPVMMIVFPVIHLAVGVGMTYYLIATLLNTTTIRVSREAFSVQFDPVPWPGEIKSSVGEISQLYCTQKISHGKNSTTITYNLNAVLKDGRKKELLKSLESPDVAGFVEQTVETFLDIPDRRVAGEAPVGLM